MGGSRERKLLRMGWSCEPQAGTWGKLDKAFWGLLLALRLVTAPVYTGLDDQRVRRFTGKGLAMAPSLARSVEAHQKAMMAASYQMRKTRVRSH